MARKYPREIQGETKDGRPIERPEPEPDYQDVANISAYLKQRAKEAREQSERVWKKRYER